MSTHSFENKKSVPVRVLSFHFANGKMKTAILEIILVNSRQRYFLQIDVTKIYPWDKLAPSGG
ncbi:MAG TPA: hypothetical protein DCZ88_02015 [Pseudanabaena sp.]|nr:hypothetical protein [Pseudanabaena sp.]